MSKIMHPIILNLSFIPTIKYLDIRNNHTYLLNTLHLFVIVYFVALGACYMFLAYIQPNKLDIKIEKTYPFVVFIWITIYLASYGAQSFFVNMAFEPIIFIMLAMAILTIEIVLYDLAIVTTTSKTKPIIQMLITTTLFLVVIIITIANIEYKITNLVPIGSITISIFVGIFIALLLLLFGIKRHQLDL